MKIKYFLTSLIGLAISLAAMAQTNPGIDYKVLGETKLAKDYFMKTMRQTPAESYYYLGQIALEAGNTTEAKDNFEKGLSANPESALCAVGLAKLNLKSTPKEAEKALNEIKKKNKKDIVVLLEIARGFYENGLTESAQSAVADALKADKKSPLIYLFEGSVLEKQGEPGKAAMQFDQAINFDPNFTLGYIKGAQVYSHINPTIAIDMLKKASQIDPNYTLAYRYIAKLYYSNGFYPESIAAFEKVFATSPHTVDELTDYAAAQFFSGDINAAAITIEKGLKENPKHFVLNRLMMYGKNELKDYDAALSAGQTFFSIPRDTASYIIQDHMTYANILSEKGMKAEAIDQYQRALKLDPSKIELNKEIAQVCANEGMYEEAGNFYKKYNELRGEEAEASDFFLAGRYYYLAGDAARRDSTIAQTAPAILAKADAEFATVIERKPEALLGYLWRGRANALLDPETTEGLALPYYSKIVEIATADASLKESNKDDIVEAGVYLCYYSYLKFDAAKGTEKADAKAITKKHCEDLLEIDPTNNSGLQILEVVK